MEENAKFKQLSDTQQQLIVMASERLAYCPRSSGIALSFTGHHSCPIMHTLQHNNTFVDRKHLCAQHFSGYSASSAAGARGRHGESKAVSCMAGHKPCSSYIEPCSMPQTYSEHVRTDLCVRSVVLDLSTCNVQHSGFSLCLKCVCKYRRGIDRVLRLCYFAGKSDDLNEGPSSSSIIFRWGEEAST